MFFNISSLILKSSIICDRFWFNFIFYTCGHTVFPASMAEKVVFFFFFSVYAFNMFVENYMAVVMCKYVWLFYFVSFVYKSISVLVPCCFITTCVIYNVNLLKNTFLHGSTSTVYGPFYFHFIFWKLFYFCKEISDKFYWD